METQDTTYGTGDLKMDQQQLTVMRLRRQLMSITDAREELWLQGIENTSLNHSKVQQIRRQIADAARMDQNNDQRDATRNNYRHMCETQEARFALIQQAWQEEVDALRLHARECFTDPAWRLVHDSLRQKRNEEIEKLETIQI